MNAEVRSSKSNRTNRADSRFETLMDLRSSVRLALTPVAVGSLLLTAGCQSLMRSAGLDSGANPKSHEEVRTLLATAQYEAALERIGPDGDAAPTDVALWLLYQGTVAHHAGRYAESAEALDLAHYVSEARYTRRVGTGLFSLITNDRVLPYVPDRTERLLIHYYAALDYLMLDQPLEAAVEARRLSFMLERYADEPPLRDHVDLVVHMRLVAGLIFQFAGELNDAAVAFRIAKAAAEKEGNRILTPIVAAANPSATDVPARVALDALLPARVPGGSDGMPPDSMGDVIVLIERGFIAPRVEESVDVAVWEHELEAVGFAGAVSRVGAATCLADYVMRNTDPLALSGRIEADDDEIERCVPVPDDWDERKRGDEDDEDTGESDSYEHDGRPVPAPDMNRPPAAVVKGVLEPPAPKNTAAVRGPADPGADPDADPALGLDKQRDRATGSRSVAGTGPEKKYLRVAMPTYPARVAGVASAPSSAFIGVGGLDPLNVSLSIDLSACVMDEFATDVPFVLAKTIARAASRQAIARGLSAAGDEGDVLAGVLGFLAGVAGDAMERADTRSWSLLPASLGIARLRLPVGEHAIVIEPDNSGLVRGCDLGAVRVEAGRTPILSCRVWN